MFCSTCGAEFVPEPVERGDNPIFTILKIFTANTSCCQTCTAIYTMRPRNVSLIELIETRRLKVKEERAKAMQAEIVALESEVKQLRSDLSDCRSFRPFNRCRKCRSLYPKGYICACGEDNSVPPVEEKKE
jgi:hypothetical protein